MLFEILKHIRNYFPDKDHQIEGHFKVEGGAIDPFPVLANHQYFMIEGSAMNDGVWNDTTSTMFQDEEFDGIITPLRIPRAFLDLVDEIEEYQQNETPSAYVSESFAGYSYSKGQTASGKLQSWQNVFGTRLNSWRKI